MKAQGDALVLELMHFSGEIIDSDELRVPGEVKLAKKESDMAKQLVESMTGKWNPESYKDDYREALMEVIAMSDARRSARSTKCFRNAGMRSRSRSSWTSIAQTISRRSRRSTMACASRQWV